MKAIRREKFDEAMLIRLFRLWSICRENAHPPLPKMHEEAMKLGYAVETAAACSSFFELIEAKLERKLSRECCCSVTFSPDESALIGVLRTTSIEKIFGSEANEDGLGDAIVWAASSVRAAMHHAPDSLVTRIDRPSQATKEIATRNAFPSRTPRI